MEEQEEKKEGRPSEGNTETEIIIEDGTVYEIDLECMKRKRNQIRK